MRALRARWGFATCTVVSIGLGIWLTCATTATVFSVVRPALSYFNPRDLVQIEETGLFGASKVGIALPVPKLPVSHLKELREDSAFAGVAQYEHASVVLSDDDVATRNAYVVSHDLFRLLGVRPLIGRWFTEAEDVDGGGNVAVLSHRFWQSAFGGDSAVLGQAIQTRRGELRVIGVMPATFTFPPRLQPELYVPLGSQWAPLQARTTRILARLRSGVSLERAREVALRIAAGHLETDRAQERLAWVGSNAAVMIPDGRIDIRIRRYQSERLGDPTVPTLGKLLIGSTVLLGLTGLANIINLLIIRLHERRGEFAVRHALGASHVDLVRLVLVEIVVLAIVGTGLGIVLALLQARVLAESHDTLGLVASLEWSELLTIGASATGALTVVGTIIAFVMTARPLGGLRQSGAQATVASYRVMRRIVAVAIGLATALITLATTFAESAARAAFSDPGYVESSVYAISVRNRARNRDGRTGVQLLDLERLLQHVPGVTMVAVGPPPRAQNPRAVTIAPDGGEEQDLGLANVAGVGHRYFDVLRIPILAGRGLSAEEAKQGTATVVLSQSAARRIFGDTPAIGQRIRVVLDRADTIGAAEVVGIAGDVSGPDAIVGTLNWSQLYFPASLMRSVQSSLLMRGRTEDEITARSVVLAVMSASTFQVMRFASLAELRPASAKQRVAFASAFGAFGVAGLVLAAIGVYGIMAFLVSTRAPEIGIRMALGASRGVVVRMILVDSARLAAVGMGTGVLFCAGTLALVGSAIYGLPVFDPKVYAASIVLLTVVAIAAGYVPARRAAATEPMTSLGAR